MCFIVEPLLLPALVAVTAAYERQELRSVTAGSATVSVVARHLETDMPVRPARPHGALETVDHDQGGRCGGRERSIAVRTAAQGSGNNGDGDNDNGDLSHGCEPPLL